MKKIYLILLGLFCILGMKFSLANSVGTTVLGDGQFYAQSDDSLSFVKKQLIYSAFKDVITKELKNLGLDPEPFWQSYDARFEEYFKKPWEDLKQKYTDKTTGEINDTDKYHKELREKKFTLQSRFGRLDRALISYSEQQMSRSVENASSRYLKISAHVDRKILSEMYRRFLVSGSVRSFSTIYISSSFDLVSTSWQELGVANASDLTDTVNNHWKKWVSENYSGVVAQVFVANDDKINELDKLYRTPRAANIVINESLSTFKSEGDESFTAETSGGTLWVKINIRVSKLSENVATKRREFEIGGDAIVLDIQERNSVSSVDFNKEILSYSTANDHQLSSNIASFIYQRPLEMLTQFKEKVVSMEADSGVVVIDILNIDSIVDLMSFNEYVATKGVVLQLKLSIASYDGKQGKVEVRYSGDREKLISFFKALPEQIISETLRVEVPVSNPFSLTLKKMAKRGEG